MSFDPSTATPDDGAFDPSSATPDNGLDTRTVLQAAVQTNPDQAAKASKLAKKYDAPDDVLYRNLQNVELIDAVNRYDEKLKTSPKLAEAMRRKPALAKQAHDDIEPLAKIESNMAATTAASLGTSVLGLSEGVWRIPDAAQRGVGYLAETVERTGLPQYLNPVRGLQDLIRLVSEGSLPTGYKFGAGTTDVANLVKGSTQLLTDDTQTFGTAFADNAKMAQNADKALKTAIETGQVQQLGQVLADPQYWLSFMANAAPSLAAAYASGGSVQATMLLEALGESTSAADFEQRTGTKISNADYVQAVAQTAVINGLLEKYGLDKVMGVKGQGIAGLFKAITAEGGTEVLQQINNNLAEAISYDGGKSLTDGLVASFMGGAGSGGALHTVNTAAGRVQAQIDKQEQKRVAADKFAAQMQDAMQTAAESKLRERNPEEFRELMQTMTDGKVYVDGQVLNQLPPEVRATLPQAVQDQIDVAAATGDTVEIPVADVLTAAPGTPLEQMFVEHARTDPFAMSQAEAREEGAKATELLQARFEEAIANAQDQDAFRMSAETVRQNLLDQLNTTGRYRPAVAEGMSQWAGAFYSTMASRLGMTPEEMYAKYPLRILGEAQDKGAVLNSGGKPGEVTVEGYHFSMADRPTLSTGFFGRGLKGSARDEIMAHPDERIKQRLSFYVDLGKGILPETGVGGRAHRAQLTNIYDSDLDPLKLRSADARAFESKVLDAGFSGYLSRMGGASQGQVILLGKQSVQPELLGPKSRIEAGRRAPALPTEPAKWEVQASGEPSMLQMKLERMQSNPSWAGYDMRVEGRELQVRKKTEGAYEQSLSSRLPSAVKATEDPLTDVLNITHDVVLSDAKTLAKNVAALQGLPNMRKLKGKGAKDPVRNVEAFIDHVTNNLLWLHDHVPAEMRDRARLWYDGGRKTVEAWAKRYGISEMQGAAAIAVLSPQNGWFANVSQAERIADMVFGLRDYVWDDAMTAEAERISPGGVLDDKMQAAVGKSLGELLTTPDIAARWVRVYDQTHNNRAYRVLTPEGGAAEYVKTGAGADATMMWKSYSTIAKAISVLTDGRAENVHYQIGKEHKVRNFYNNIFDPDSPFGYATIDTHAVAAALLRPLASADVEVAQAFGGAGSASSAVTGLNGTYPIYLEAYRRAAEARGIQPRQMQSITWEAVRGLFEATAKRGMKAPANAIWERYKAGEIEQAQAQQEILALAGDITPPAWVSVPFNDTVARTYEGAPQITVDSRPAVDGAESKVMFEVAPDPNDVALTEEWNTLTSAERLEISQRVAARIVPEVLKELGTGGDFVLQLGGYLGATNPSMTLRLERPELALTAAKMLGHALSQDSMMVVAETPFVGSEPVGVVTLHLPEGYGETEVTALYDRLWQLKNEQGQELVGGHTTSDGQMVILNYSGLDDADLAARIDAHLGGEFDVDIDTVYSAFPSKEDYGYGDQRQEGAAPASQSPAQRRPSDLRTAATESLRAELDARRTARAAAAGASTQGQVNDGRLEQAGDRGAGRSAGRSLAPLEGAPSVPGFQGPDPRLVAVAEQYARDNGIDLKRQAEFVEVDPERAARIAAAYEAMEHAPNDPAVREAYENLIQQTRAQYDALVAAGYKFWFMDLSREDNQQYASSPWNAMRDIRANQSMGVFPTNDGFGSGEDFSPEANPLLADTGLQWPVGGPDGPLAPVLANDLFRAVHDAFGHGLEGAGFRARGEENAWQAHVRLFTGSAVGAITSETRGQNSWLNYGPHGEKNRTALVEDTVFADQKTGLMPEWTWTEGRAGDMPADVLEQGPRGTFNPSTLELVLNPNADLSTFFHETGHFFLEVMADIASQPNAPAQIADDMNKLLAWFGIKGDEAVGGADSGVPLAQAVEQGYEGSDAGEAREWLAAVAKGLDMSLEARMQRAQAMGFDTGKTLYHSSLADTKEFAPFGQFMGFTGTSGISVTDSPEMASRYLDRYAEYGWVGGKPNQAFSKNVIPVFIKPGKVLERNEPFLMPPGMRLGAPLPADYVPAHKKMGYDTLVRDDAVSRKGPVKHSDAKNAIRGKEYVLTDPSQVRSVFAAFDPDNATSGNLLAQDGNLPADNTQPVRRTPLETWRAMTLDQKRKYHERFAESVEQYLMEGKAPSLELQPVMRRFRAWLLSVYKSIQQFVAGRPDAAEMALNDEIRSVMDRMVATDEQIAQANEIAGLVPDAEADAAAAERLQARSMRDLKWMVNARDKVIKKLTKQARTIEKDVRAQVTAEVEQMPEVRAKQALAEAEAAHEADPISADFNAAAIADAFGFPTVDAMYAAIDRFGDPQVVIDGMTEQRMLEDHGDLIDERAIQEAANEAIHNEVRARVLATELRTQREMLNPRRDTGETTSRGSKITVNALVEAAKQFGQNVADRTVLKDMKAKIWQHTAAERRAAKAWQEATAAGKTQEAVKAKQDQMLQNAAAKSLLEAKTDAQKILDFFKRVAKGNDETVVEKGRDPDIVNAARAVLAAYGVETTTTKRASEYLELVKKHDPEAYSVVAPGVEAALAMAQPLDALTFEELQGLHEEIQALWYKAKASRQIEIDGDLMDIQDAEDELKATNEAIGIPDTMPGDTSGVTPAQARARKLQHYLALSTRAESWAGLMGPAYTRYVWNPIKEAATAYRTDSAKYIKALRDLLEPIAPTLKRETIAAPELNYTFGEDVDTDGVGMNELLHALLHTGNDSNKRKLLLGRGWATDNGDGTIDTTQWDAFIKRMQDEGRLTKAHYDFAQGVWDLLEDTKAKAQETHRRVFGRYFAEVTANEFETPFGTYRGGYVPATPDARTVSDAASRRLAEDESAALQFAFPTTAKGFTKGRVEYNVKLRLDLRTLSGHLDKVLLFSNMEAPVRDVRRLLTRKGVAYGLNRINPEVFDSVLTPWLNRASKQLVADPSPNSWQGWRMWSTLRNRAGMAAMFGNVANAVQQVAGFSMAAVKVSPKFLVKATAQFVAAPRQTADMVAELSPYMAQRLNSEARAMTEAVNDILLNPSVYESGKNFVQRHAYFAQSAVASVMEPIIWAGAYNEALAGGASELEAVRAGDAAVRQTQGANAPEDISSIEAGSPFARMFNQFAGYFNMQANLLGTEFAKIARDVGLRKGAGRGLYVLAFGFLVNAWVAEAVMQLFKGGPDDEDKDGEYLDDWLAQVFGWSLVRNATAIVPVFGQAAVAVGNAFNNKPYDDRIATSPAISMIESAARAPVDLYKTIVEGEDVKASKTVRDVGTAISMLLGVPVTPVTKAVGYVADTANGDVQPTGPVDAVRGAVTGTPSPESKR